MPRFCPRCGGLMNPVKQGDKVYLECTRCKYRVEASVNDLKTYKLTVRINHSEKEKTIIIDTVNTANLPVTREITCPKCGHSEAYYWMMQTRAADEPATRFYKCVKCGHVWREYD